MPGPIEAKTVRYIKLGPGGAWESLCLSEGTLRLGHREIPHALAETRDRAAIRQRFLDLGIDSGKSTDKAREVLEFYDGDESVIWITFSTGFMWWCRAGATVEDLGAGNAQGSRLRRALTGWSNRSTGGQPLHFGGLSGQLTKTAAYRQTICNVAARDYVLARLNDQSLPEVEAAAAARLRLIECCTTLITLLTPKDFELLVDLIFVASGWRRTGVLGGTQKTVDIELELPTTGERAFVQVKSATGGETLAAYVDELERRGEDRLFFAYHSAAHDLQAASDRVTVLGPQRLAAMALEAGLVDWLIRKVS